jgi:hypothetical protein
MTYKKKLLALALLVTSLACTNSSVKNAPSESNIDNYNIRLGKIYIGDQDYLDSIETINSNDILVLDLRSHSDPDMKVIDSYKITDPISMDKVINTILEYENNDPSEWQRTYDSMKYEWVMHNFAYYMNYQLERSKDVDFNNNDEFKYSKSLSKSKEYKKIDNS